MPRSEHSGTFVKNSLIGWGVRLRLQSSDMQLCSSCASYGKGRSRSAASRLLSESGFLA